MSSVGGGTWKEDVSRSSGWDSSIDEMHRRAPNCCDRKQWFEFFHNEGPNDRRNSCRAIAWWIEQTGVRSSKKSRCSSRASQAQLNTKMPSHSSALQQTLGFLLFDLIHLSWVRFCCYFFYNLTKSPIQCLWMNSYELQTIDNVLLGITIVVYLSCQCRFKPFQTIIQCGLAKGYSVSKPYLKDTWVDREPIINM